jgi:hypothetical protein
MPWHVVAKNGEFCVVVSEGPKKGSEVACHATREKALSQVRALYANVKSEGGAKETKRLPY